MLKAVAKSSGRASGNSKLQLVANRGLITESVRQGTANARSDVRIETRHLQWIGPSPVTQLKAAFPAFQFKQGGEALIGNAVNYECALELISPSMYFSGLFYANSVISVPDGTPLMMTDLPFPYVMDAGQQFWFRQGFSVANSSMYFPYSGGMSVITSPSGETYWMSPSTVSQIPGTGPLVNPSGGTGSNTATCGGIYGVPLTPHPAVIFIGDSIGDGSGDTLGDPVYGASGFLARGCSQVNGFQMPYLKNTVSGFRLGNYSRQLSPRGRAYWPYISDLCIQAASNDILDATSLATMQNRFIAVAGDAKKTISNVTGKPLRVTGVKVMPRTSSTDSWATAANQTPSPGFAPGGVRDQYNAWLDSGASGYCDYVIDPNPYVEDQANHGKWITNGTPNYPTTDGSHPTTALHILAAQAVNAWYAALSV